MNLSSYQCQNQLALFTLDHIITLKNHMKFIPLDESSNLMHDSRWTKIIHCQSVNSDYWVLTFLSRFILTCIIWLFFFIRIFFYQKDKSKHAVKLFFHLHISNKHKFHEPSISLVMFLIFFKDLDSITQWERF